MLVVYFPCLAAPRGVSLLVNFASSSFQGLMQPVSNLSAWTRSERRRDRGQRDGYTCFVGVIGAAIV